MDCTLLLLCLIHMCKIYCKKWYGLHVAFDGIKLVSRYFKMEARWFQAGFWSLEDGCKMALRCLKMDQDGPDMPLLQLVLLLVLVLVLLLLLLLLQVGLKLVSRWLKMAARWLSQCWCIASATATGTVAGKRDGSIIGRWRTSMRSVCAVCKHDYFTYYLLVFHLLITNTIPC